jgi:hypothetical protein
LGRNRLSRFSTNRGMSGSDPMTDKLDGTRRARPGRWVLSLFAILIVVGIVVAFWRANRGPEIVGVWKGTDAHGHEHYFKFRKDGTLEYWDRDRQHDGSFADRPHFQGSYSAADSQTVSVIDSGWPAHPLGRLTLVSPNELKQEGGPAMRENLVYERFAAK